MTAPDPAALRALLARCKADTPLDAEGFIVFGADGEVVAECSDSVLDAKLIAAAVNALPKLLDRLEKLERVAEAAEGWEEANARAQSANEGNYARLRGERAKARVELHSALADLERAS